eukprot:2786213-Pyramimonas_sp.AAC.1
MPCCQPADNIPEQTHPCGPALLSPPEMSSISGSTEGPESKPEDFTLIEGTEMRVETPGPKIGTGRRRNAK